MPTSSTAKWLVALADADADADGDGALAAPELRRLLAACGLSADQAQRVFAELDLDSSASVDEAERVAAIRAFCLDPGANWPGARLFGTI